MTTTYSTNFTVINGWLAPGGMVNENMEARAKRVVLGAQVRAPVGSRSYIDRYGFSHPGALRASGRAEPGELMGQWDALFAIYYAWFVDQGTIYMDPRYYLTQSLGLAVE